MMEISATFQPGDRTFHPGTASAKRLRRGSHRSYRRSISPLAMKFAIEE
jgi:hypothetical protein